MTWGVGLPRGAVTCPTPGPGAILLLLSLALSFHFGHQGRAGNLVHTTALGPLPSQWDPPHRLQKPEVRSELPVCFDKQNVPSAFKEVNQPS
jgi:hypothetical protein